MLLRFRCKNYKSIRDLTELNLTSAATRAPEREDSLLETPIKGVKALRAAVIYGANASGKSNLLEAMRQFSVMVATSQSRWEPTAEIPSFDPFALDQKSKTEETLMEMEFVINKHVFNYGFTFSKSTFTGEWLSDITGSRDKVLFRRTGEMQNFSINFPGKNLASTAKELELLLLTKEQTRSNSLFLSAAAQNNNPILSEIFEWISSRFNLLRIKETPYFRGREADLWSDPERKQQVIRLLAFADVGIVDYEITEQEEPEEVKKLTEAIFKTMREVMGREISEPAGKDSDPKRHSIKMLHKGADGVLYPMDLGKESSGTRAYFMMVAPILRELSTGGLLLVDEFESSLHPLLARQMVRMFNEAEFNPLGSQLVFTTHNTHLLDLDLLRRDQIWFVDKDQSGASSLTPLSDYKPRKEQDVAAAYLHGRFGSVPLLDENQLRSALAPSSGDDHMTKKSGEVIGTTSV